MTNYIPQSDYTDTPPKELLDQWASELEPKPTLDNTAFYATDEDGGYGKACRFAHRERHRLRSPINCCRQPALTV